MGFSDATVKPPGLSRVAPASVRRGTFPSAPSTRRKTWRAPLTQFLRAVVLQLAMRLLVSPAASVPKGSGWDPLLIWVFRFWFALAVVPQKPNPMFVGPKLSR